MGLPFAAVVMALLALPALAAADGHVDPQSLLRQHVEDYGGAPAVIAVVIERNPAPGSSRRSVYTYGSLDGRSLNEDTLFEIGSITKVFTSLLLADMVRRGELRLDTTIGELTDTELDANVASITLQELSRHTSGLPRIPMNVDFWMRILFRSDDPYAGTKSEGLFDALQSIDPQSRGEFAYSNFGAALLGQLLAGRAGKPYAELLDERVLRPMGLRDMHVDVASAPEDRLAQGYRSNGLATSHWHFGAYAPAGSLVASAASLGAFVAQRMDADRPLWRFTAGDGASEAVRLGWMRDRIGAHTLIWHNGGTGGFSSFAGFLPKRGRGVVVLSNGGAPVDRLARQLLGLEVPASPSRLRLVWTVVTVAMMLMAPLGLAARRLRRRRPGASGVRRSENRWDVIAMLAGYAFVYAVFIPFGSWTVVPIWIAWLSIGIAGALALTLLPELRRLEWRGGATRWQLGWSVMSAIVYTGLTTVLVL